MRIPPADRARVVSGRGPADTNVDQAPGGGEAMRVPAAPPAPEDTGRAQHAALTSRRSRSSWTSLQQPRAGLNRHAKAAALRKGLAIRPTHGYSWRTRHMWVLLAKHRLVGRPQWKDRAGTRSFAFYAATEA